MLRKMGENVFHLILKIYLHPKCILWGCQGHGEGHGGSRGGSQGGTPILAYEKSVQKSENGDSKFLYKGVVMYQKLQNHISWCFETLYVHPTNSICIILVTFSHLLVYF